ncbi:MAG TPA: hypothetical protein VHM02_01865, partial [Thermoanaerobaculia bacterium]|nr:hypothetical protein [Thermoanaerobaculia bacterium]
MDAAAGEGAAAGSSGRRGAAALAAAGAVAWVAWLVAVRPEPFATAWIRALLLLAPLVLFPLAVDLLPRSSVSRSASWAPIGPAAGLACALLLAASLALPPGLPAAALALP